MIVQSFNGQEALTITHRITISLQIGEHYQPSYEFLITDLGHNDLIIGNEWMTLYGAIPIPAIREV